MRARCRLAILILLVACVRTSSVYADGDRPSIPTSAGIRCSFTLATVATWSVRDVPSAVVKPSTLVLRFESIDTDLGTAQLRSGTIGTDIVVRPAGGYLHFMQTFKTGSLYTTTIFPEKTARGAFKAVHSRHEYFSTALAGATSSPEQYYGECEPMK
jgi:hypothetical protein